jgi:N-acetylglutamate synthase-like GNAT family acetyltransferase
MCNSNSISPILRVHLKPGDIGYLTQLHGILYAKEYGFDKSFEAYVAKGLADFALATGPDNGCIWLAELEGKIIGSIAIVKFSDHEAQLRWYLVHPDCRGSGLGITLISEALNYCHDKQFKSVFLWTTSELTAAAHLYIKAGFIKTEQKTHMIWGKLVTEERYNLDL